MIETRNSAMVIVKQITIFAFLIILAVHTACDNNSKAQSGEKNTLESIQINTDLTLISLFLPQDSVIILCNGPFALCSRNVPWLRG